MTRVTATPHDWVWTGYSEGHYFGDPDKPYAVDHWICSKCRKEATTKGTTLYMGPKDGRCAGRPKETP